MNQAELYEIPLTRPVNDKFMKINQNNGISYSDALRFVLSL